MPQKRTVPLKTVTWLACTLLVGLSLGSCTAPEPGTNDPTASPAGASCMNPVVDLDTRTDLDKQVLFVQHETFGEQPTMSRYPLEPFEPSLTWQGAEPGIGADELLPLLDERAEDMSVHLTPLSFDSADADFDHPESGDEVLVYRFVQPVQLDYTLSCQGQADYHARVVTSAESGTVVLDCLAPETQDDPLAATVRKDYC